MCHPEGRTTTALVHHPGRSRPRERSPTSRHFDARRAVRGLGSVSVRRRGASEPPRSRTDRGDAGAPGRDGPSSSRRPSRSRASSNGSLPPTGPVPRERPDALRGEVRCGCASPGGSTGCVAKRMRVRRGVRRCQVPGVQASVARVGGSGVFRKGQRRKRAVRSKVPETHPPRCRVAGMVQPGNGMCPSRVVRLVLNERAARRTTSPIGAERVRSGPCRSNQA